MSPIDLVTYIISLLIVATQAGLFLLFALFIIQKFSTSARKIHKSLWQAAGKFALWKGFIVSFGVTLLSMFYSNIANFEPCLFCWYQRIFMFPQALLFGMALKLKDRAVLQYTRALSLIGIVLAVYHYYIQTNSEAAAACSGLTISCASTPFVMFGYITIPMMSLTAFALLFVISQAGLNWKKK